MADQSIDFDSSEIREIKRYVREQIADGVPSVSTDQINSTFRFVSTESELTSELGNGNTVIVDSDITVSARINQFGNGDTLIIPTGITSSLAANVDDVMFNVGPGVDDVTIQVDGVVDGNGSNQGAAQNIISVIEGCDNPTIKGSGEIRNAAGSGISFSGNPTVTNPSARDIRVVNTGVQASGTATGDGILVKDATDATISGVTIDDAWRGGIVAEDKNSTPTDGLSIENSVVKNSAVGIWAESSTQVTANGCVFRSNAKLNGFSNNRLVAGAVAQTNLKLVGCEFIDSRRQPMRIGPGASLTATTCEIRNWNTANESQGYAAVNIVAAASRADSVTVRDCYADAETNSNFPRLVACRGASGNYGAEKVLIAGCTAVDMDTAILLNADNPTTEATFRDNTLTAPDEGITTVSGIDVKVFGNTITSASTAAYNFAEAPKHRDNDPVPSVDMTTLPNPENGDGPYYHNGNSGPAAGQVAYQGGSWTAL